MPNPPSVDALARELADTGLPHPLLVDAARAAIGAGDPASARAQAEAVAAALLRPVINATGVLLHTNLGRAPLGASGSADSGRYMNLEFDLASGRRGSRSDHAARLLARAAGAEAALVVNNNAAAVMLVLAALARDRQVLVSRGELVEIGGGFRVPEVMEQSGCRLVEVGATNRTRVADYAAAMTADGGAADVAGAGPGAVVALILKVHQSNYRIVGFTETVEIGALADLGAPVVVDLGSGLLDAATPWLRAGPPAWLNEEPAVRQTLQAGAALVTFSGDKLLGGPQAGIIAGRADLVEACRRHPLNRALRAGGLVLGALQETAMAYLRRDGDAIPFWRMAATPVETLRARASGLGAGTVVDTVAVAGGGSVPGQEVPSVGVAVPGDHAAALRAHDPPVIARVHEHMTICDLRTVDPADDAVLAKALGQACA
ncbi:MAG TPA: L-seryl-tRNA(Sec) selenium transferase [Acidimicrobiales bacterium]|nr:L-seryl-tRNA(Sec) selenium transferase [Acidimicrobiales bacterium]